MTQYRSNSICDSVTFHSIKDTRFKTMRMSVHFLIPLEQKSAAANALLPFLLTRACKDYPDYTALSKRLAELYGASVSAEVGKMGDVQVLTLTAVGIADRYCFGGEQISAELAALLCQMVFEPPFDEEGNFRQEDFRQEKRQTLENIEAEFNDKRSYAKLRCEQIMCADEPYGIGRYGTKEDVTALTREELKAAWESLIRSARVEVMVSGNCEPEAAAEDFRKAFQAQNRAPRNDFDTKVVLQAGEVKDVTEPMQVAQSKLVMGFRTGTQPDTPETMQMRLMCAMLGGTPHSKLFLNVREKLSLCYYCSSQYNTQKGIMLIQSGVETKNMEAAKTEILKQLAEMQAGNFTEEEMISAKLSVSNSYRTVGDYLSGMEQWYLGQVFRKDVVTPEDSVKELQAVTRQQVIDAANRVTLDTIYRLAGSEGNA